MRRKLDVNFTRRTLGILAAGTLAGLWLGLAAGCSTPSSSQKVYDRYAELVASRNQPAKTATSAAAPTASAPRAVSKTAAPTDRLPPKPAAAAASTAPAKSSSAPAVRVPSAPAPAAPVQVVAPKPAEKAAPAPVARPAAVPTSAPARMEPAAPEMSLPESVSSAEGGYLLKVGDGVQVFLRGIPSPDLIEDIIDEGGRITLPLINEVQAAGLAASELERNIRQIYLDQDIYRNITVNVVVPTRSYFILGEVRSAGRFQILSATRVSQAIAAAGGYTEFASGKVQIKRRGKIVKVIKNARKLERSPEDDILLEPDDVIEVLRSWF